MTASSTALPACAGGLPVRKEYLVFGSPRIDAGDAEAVADVIRSRWLGTGPQTAAFEQAFAGYVGARHAVAVSSCTAALHVALAAAGIKPGDEVIVPAMTFVATANSVIHAGGTPVLCDVDPATQNMRACDVDRVRTPRTRAIIPVHFAGRAVDMTELAAYAGAYGLLVVNDAAHAIETRHRGRPVPAFGAMTAYSFYPTKNITTGEGGMVVTDDQALAERLRVWRLHGLSADAWKRFSASGFKHYEAVEPGFKYNMTDMQAVLGLRQLARIEEMSATRERIWDTYDRAFAGLPVTRPAPVASGDRHARHLYTVLLHLEALTMSRDEIAQALHAEGIGTGVHYQAVHLHPFYRDRMKCRREDYPNASRISERTLSLPLSASMTEADAGDVVEALTRILAYAARASRAA